MSQSRTGSAEHHSLLDPRQDQAWVTVLDAAKILLWFVPDVAAACREKGSAGGMLCSPAPTRCPPVSHPMSYPSSCASARANHGDLCDLWCLLLLGPGTSSPPLPRTVSSSGWLQLGGHWTDNSGHGKGTTKGLGKKCWSKNCSFARKRSSRCFFPSASLPPAKAVRPEIPARAPTHVTGPRSQNGTK